MISFEKRKTSTKTFLFLFWIFHLIQPSLSWAQTFIPTPQSRVGLSTSFDLQSWATPHGRIISQALNRSLFHLHSSFLRYPLSSRPHREPTLTLFIQGQLQSDLALNTLDLQALDQPQVMGLISNAHLAWNYPRAHVHLKLGRQPIQTTQFIRSIDGVTLDWQGKSWCKVSLFGGFASDWHFQGWGTRQGDAFYTLKNLFQWQNQTLFRSSSPSERQSFFSPQGVLYGGFFDFELPWKGILFRPSFDQRITPSGVAQERIGWNLKVPLSTRWNLLQKSSASTLLRRWTHHIFQISYQRSVWQSQIQFQWIHPLWDLDTLWWVFNPFPYFRTDLSTQYSFDQHQLQARFAFFQIQHPHSTPLFQAHLTHQVTFKSTLSPLSLTHHLLVNTHSTSLYQTRFWSQLSYSNLRFTHHLQLGGSFISSLERPHFWTSLQTRYRWTSALWVMLSLDGGWIPYSISPSSSFSSLTPSALYSTPSTMETFGVGTSSVLASPKGHWLNGLLSVLYQP